MSVINSHHPGRCTICGFYLTTIEAYAGHRCLDPSHWQACGLLAPSDFYPMAQIAAVAHAELSARLHNQIHSG